MRVECFFSCLGASLLETSAKKILHRTWEKRFESRLLKSGVVFLPFYFLQTTVYIPVYFATGISPVWTLEVFFPSSLLLNSSDLWGHAQNVKRSGGREKTEFPFPPQLDPSLSLWSSHSGYSLICP